MSIASISGCCFTEPRSDSARDSWLRNRSRDQMTHQEAVDTLAVERYLLDEMSDEHRQTFEEHYFQCETCADDLRIATAMLQGAREGFANRAAIRKAAWHRSVALP